MPKWLIVTLAFLIVILVGVNGYLFYSYFTTKSQNAALPTPAPTISLNGEIKPGWQLPLDKGYCAKSYYLVDSSRGAIEIKPVNQVTANIDFRGYSNVTVTATGTNQKADGSSCGDFVNITTLTLIKSNLLSFDVKGVISCLPGEDPTSGTCTKNLQIGNANLALIGNNVGLDSLKIGDNVEVTGITDNSFDSPLPFSGAIQVFTIKKL